MPEILDHFDGEGSPKSTLSKLSFAFALLTLTLFVLVASQISSTITASEGITPPPYWLVSGAQVSCLSGLVSAILSYTRRERLRYFKAIGGLVNLLLFLLWAGTVWYAFALDQSRKEFGKSSEKSKIITCPTAWGIVNRTS